MTQGKRQWVNFLAIVLVLLLAVLGSYSFLSSSWIVITQNKNSPETSTVEELGLVTFCVGLKDNLKCEYNVWAWTECLGRRPSERHDTRYDICAAYVSQQVLMCSFLVWINLVGVPISIAVFLNRRRESCLYHASSLHALIFVVGTLLTLPVIFLTIYNVDAVWMARDGKASVGLAFWTAVFICVILAILATTFVVLKNGADEQKEKRLTIPTLAADAHKKPHDQSSQKEPPKHSARGLMQEKTSNNIQTAPMRPGDQVKNHSQTGARSVPATPSRDSSLNAKTGKKDGTGRVSPTNVKGNFKFPNSFETTYADVVDL